MRLDLAQLEMSMIYYRYIGVSCLLNYMYIFFLFNLNNRLSLFFMQCVYFSDWYFICWQRWELLSMFRIIVET